MTGEYIQLTFESIDPFTTWGEQKVPSSSHKFFIERWGEWHARVLEWERFFWNGAQRSLV